MSFFELDTGAKTIRARFLEEGTVTFWDKSGTQIDVEGQMDVELDYTEVIELYESMKKAKEARK